MKAMVLKAANTAFVLDTVPDPVPGPGEAVARVLACGSGLTIQHVKAGRLSAKFPRIIGHEITGEIVEVGPAVTGLAVGVPVTAYYYLNCGHCRWCLSGLEPLCEAGEGNVGKDCDGGYAEYIKLPSSNFIPLPERLDYKTYPAEIGVITDALATPLKVLKRGRIKAGETIAVFGAGGGLGIHMLMMAHWAHTRVIAVDVAVSKLDACRAAGADETVDATAGNVTDTLLELTGGDGVDVAIDFVSSTSTLEAAAKALGRRGRLITLGGSGELFQADSQAMLMKEQDLLGSRYVTHSEVVDALSLVAAGEVWPMVTEIRPLEEANDLHDRIEAGEVIGRAAVLID